MSDFHQEEVLIGLDKAVAFFPGMSKAFGGIHEALLFQQFYFWRKLGSREDGFIYKTKHDIEEEICIKRHHQDKARARLEELGVLETRLLKANGSPTLHYRVNVAKANEVLAVARLGNGKAEISDSEKSKSTNGKAEISDSITKKTTKNTQRDIDTHASVSSKTPKTSPPKPQPQPPTDEQPATNEPNQVYQLVDYVRTCQGHSEYTNLGMHLRNAKLTLATYSLDEAKQAADLMLKEDFWRDKGITTKNLAEHIHRFIGQVRANPYVDDPQKCITDYKFVQRLPRVDSNEICEKHNVHWMGLEKICHEIMAWMQEHQRTRSDIRMWLSDELGAQADELRQKYGPYFYQPPDPYTDDWKGERP